MKVKIMDRKLKNAFKDGCGTVVKSTLFSFT